MSPALIGRTAVLLFLVAAVSCSPEESRATGGPGRDEADVREVPRAQAPAGDEGPDHSTDSTADAQCDDDDIACQETAYQLEETLFMYEAAVAKAIGEDAQACWNEDLAAFRRTQDDCADTDCRHARLRERVASLSGLQPPGQRADIPLPPRWPLLVAVLAPENGSEADEDATPFQARGDLVHASTDREHMGVAVRDGPREHVLVFDMDIGDQPGHEAIMGLVGTSPTTRVLARGYRSIAPDGIANFDTGRCRLVYQLVR